MFEYGMSNRERNIIMLQAFGEIRRKRRETYYRTCPYCGASLDPEEVCDCEEAEDEWLTTTSLALDLMEMP